MRSVFGDADDAVIVARRIHQSSRGNPRIAVEMAQDLIDRRRHQLTEAGSWLLPNKFESERAPDAATESATFGAFADGARAARMSGAGGPRGACAG